MKKNTFSWKDIFPFLGLVVVLIFFEIATEGKLISVKNLKSVLNNGIYILVGTIGYAFMLAQGNLDFSIGANMSVSCIVACIVSNSISPYLALPVALLVGSANGVINAFIHVKIGIDCFITTIATQFILNGLALVILAGGTLGAPLGMLSWFTTELKVVIIVVAIVGGLFLFEYSSFGKNCKAIGSNIEVVRQTGINITKNKFAAFILMGGLAGLLAFVSLIRTGSASNNTGESLLMNVLLASLLGGLPITGGSTAKFQSVVIGTATMTFLTSGMTIMGVTSVNQQIIKCVVFLVAVTFSFERKNAQVIK